MIKYYCYNFDRLDNLEMEVIFFIRKVLDAWCKFSMFFCTEQMQVAAMKDKEEEHAKGMMDAQAMKVIYWFIASLVNCKTNKISIWSHVIQNFVDFNIQSWSKIILLLELIFLVGNTWKSNAEPSRRAFETARFVARWDPRSNDHHSRSQRVFISFVHYKKYTCPSQVEDSKQHKRKRFSRKIKVMVSIRHKITANQPLLTWTAQFCGLIWEIPLMNTLY